MRKRINYKKLHSIKGEVILRVDMRYKVTESDELQVMTNVTPEGKIVSISAGLTS